MPQIVPAGFNGKHFAKGRVTDERLFSMGPDFVSVASLCVLILVGMDVQTPTVYSSIFQKANAQGFNHKNGILYV